MSHGTSGESPSGVSALADEQVVGTVWHHFYRWNAIGVVVAPGKQIPRGCMLRGVNVAPSRARLLANSIQLDHCDVEVGEGGQEIGIAMPPPFLPKGTKLILD